MSSIKNISLYIPHVFSNFDKDYIEEAFMDIGNVDHIDMVSKQDRTGKYYNAVYIHFRDWLNTEKAHNFYKTVTNPDQQARLYHDGPWYWIVLPNNAKKHISGDRKPRLDLDGTDAISTTTRPDARPDERPDIPIAPTLNVIEIDDLEPSMDQEMDEIERIMDEDDMHLITIDGRYVQSLEQDNMCLKAEIDALRFALFNLDRMYKAEFSRLNVVAENV